MTIVLCVFGFSFLAFLSLSIWTLVRFRWMVDEHAVDDGYLSQLPDHPNLDRERATQTQGG